MKLYQHDGGSGSGLLQKLNMRSIVYRVYV